MSAWELYWILKLDTFCSISFLVSVVVFLVGGWVLIMISDEIGARKLLLGLAMWLFLLLPCVGLVAGHLTNNYCLC